MTDSPRTPPDRGKPSPRAQPPQPGAPGSGSRPGGPVPPRGPTDAAALVRTIQRDAAEREHVRKSALRPDRAKWWYAALVAALAANLYVWVARPTWLMGPPPGPQTQQEEEGVLRFRMYVQGQRIEAYRRANGVFPERLEDTGEPLEGMRYQRTGPESWELLGEMGGAALVLRSSMPMQEFLGSYQAPLGVDGA